MVKNLLVRGMLAGLAAAALALVFAWIFGEPQVGAAIALEGHTPHGGHDPVATVPEAGADDGPVSRTVQSTIGLAAAVGVYGVAVGGIFALVFALVYGRLGAFGARATAALLAVGAFVTVSLVPFLKYPANPPAVGHPDTIGRRTALYVTFVTIVVLLGVGAVLLERWLARRYRNADAAVLAVVAFLAAVTAAALLMPGVEELPAEFPAGLLWRFRLASIGTHALLWSGMGLFFGLLAERLLTPSAIRANAPSTV
ncbi:membrane protein [Sphaerisporangium melleum]|uniref:Membrane protein n=1 Tax=Sphaerisporangium melleum TaxID=321316 RepID=A0A917RLX9_9ACTN|nr:CbtA family protein [Sphaerisporangium melleum]GGL13098.1 membrane protein [Sphaerisporangium melleum]GII69539.1 membrane protein [Sphaerisporangium melleum]